MTHDNARTYRRSYLLSWIPIVVVGIAAGGIIGGALILLRILGWLSMAIDNYKQDLTPANEHKPDCAYHAGVRAVAVLTIRGARLDVCEHCWQRLRTTKGGEVDRQG